MEAVMSEHRPSSTTAPSGMPKIAPMPVLKHEVDLEPIDLVDEAPAGPAGSPPPKSKIHQMSAPPTHAAATYKRQAYVSGHGACRVRTFHGRLSDEGMERMDEKINHWLDEHPEIEVKTVTTTAAIFEGKIREMALVVNVWY
jgi:hypothetical protein